MASLLESVGQSLTPDTLGAIGNALGLDPDMVQQGVNVVGPLVEGGLAGSTSNPQGLDSLMQLLTPPADASAPDPLAGGDIGTLLSSLGGAGGSDMLSSIMGMFSGQGASSGGNDMIGTLLTGLFGSGAMVAISRKLDDALGFKISPLIPLVTPLILGALRKMTQEKNLDASGVAEMLNQEQRTFMTSGSLEAGIVQDAIQAGKDAVALKDKYTPEEWMKVRLAPMAAAALVISAAPSGAAGKAQEVGAGVKALEESRSKADAVSLLNIALAEPLSDAEKELVSEEVGKAKLLSALRDGVGVVAAKDAGSAQAYQQAVLAVATATAEASKEGGFFGFGAARVSNAEKAVLEEIAAVFNG